MSNKEQHNYFNPVYPVQPYYDWNCEVNELYKTLPDRDNRGRPWTWERTASSPASIKHLYTGIPNFYPIRHINRPVGTMYDNELGEWEAYGKRLSYHYKVYPLTNRHAREVNPYADEVLPYMDMSRWTKHAVRRDKSLNNPTRAMEI